MCSVAMQLHGGLCCRDKMLGGSYRLLIATFCEFARMRETLHPPTKDSYCMLVTPATTLLPQFAHVITFSLCSQAHVCLHLRILQ